MICYWCEEEIGIGDDYVYLDIENGKCFHEGCEKEFIGNITQIHTNDKEDFES